MPLQLSQNASLRHWKVLRSLSPEPSFLRAEQSQFPQTVFIGDVLIILRSGPAPKELQSSYLLPIIPTLQTPFPSHLCTSGSSPPHSFSICSPFHPSATSLLVFYTLKLICIVDKEGMDTIKLRVCTTSHCLELIRKALLCTQNFSTIVPAIREVSVFFRH